MSASATRITPAYAGKTFAGSMEEMQNSDHPRVCGENTTNFIQHRFIVGSPPRMRGKPVDTPRDYGQKRITPAYAGKTDLRVAYGRQKADHPRVCGENYK